MAKNDYGEQLDRNGYAPSIIYQQEGCCYNCGRTDRPLNRHEIFHGPYRKKAKQFGLWVNLCDVCHRDLHEGSGLDRQLKEVGQEAAEVYYGWDESEFCLIFGRNYV